MLDPVHTDLFLKRYVERRLAKSKILPRGEVKIVIPMTGVRSLVRLVEVDNVPRVVVHLYSRSQIGIVDHRMLADNLIERYEIDAPKLLDLYESDKAGITALVEEFIPGKHPSPETLVGVRIEALAKSLHHLHEITSDRFGSLGGRTRRGTFARAAYGQATNRFRGVRRWGPRSIKWGARRRAKKWFRSSAQRFADLESFSLIHDKPNCGNLIWRPDCGRFSFVDLTTLGYGYRAKDLVQVNHELLGNDEAKIAEFESHYFKNGSDSLVEQYRVLAPFFHAYYHLSQCAINCRREKKRGGSLSHFGANFVEKSIHHWDQLEKIMESNRPD